MTSALHQLHNAGRVHLRGRPAAWSNALRILLMVLIGLIGVLVVGAPILLVTLAVTGRASITAGTVVSALAAIVMLALLGAVVVLVYRRHSRLRDVECSPVVLEPRGITLRGIGPIPWHDFGAAQHRMVRAEHDTGYVRRAVMELTPSGFFAVNEQLPESLRDRISPATGPAWIRQRHCIYVPGVDGLRQREVMDLINRAHWMFTSFRQV